MYLPTCNGEGGCKSNCMTNPLREVALYDADFSR